jgi:hypothetical protein
MDSNCPRILPTEMLGSHLKETINNIIRRRGSINEKQIVMFNIILKEVFLVVLLLVESYDARHAEFLEYLDILFWVVAVPLVGVSLLDGSHEGHELPRNDPVDVAVLHSLVVFVLLYIERSEIVPLELDGVLQALKALQ